MGYIKEPDNIDLNVGPMPLSTEDRLAVSAIIAQFKSTGEIPTVAGAAKEALFVGEVIDTEGGALALFNGDSQMPRP